MGMTVKTWRQARQRVHTTKFLSILPFIFTFSNSSAGFLAIVCAWEQQYIIAAYCLLVAIIMDACDGRLARALGSCSYLGLELDSLCDAVSFCLAPALLLYAWSLNESGIKGLVSLIFYVSCGLLRLARFNIQNVMPTYYFKGLPTTMAAFFISSLVLYNDWLEHTSLRLMTRPSFLMFILVALGILMMSSIHFPSFKKVTCSKRARIGYGLLAALCLFITSFYHWPLLLVCSSAYILNGLVGAVMHAKRMIILKF